MVLVALCVAAGSRMRWLEYRCTYISAGQSKGEARCRVQCRVRSPCRKVAQLRRAFGTTTLDALDARIWRNRVASSVVTESRTEKEVKPIEGF